MPRLQARSLMLTFVMNMRLLALIWMIAITWQVSSPCLADHAAEQMLPATQASTCSSEMESSHHCCGSSKAAAESSGESESAPASENHCSPGCGCLCCMLVLMPEIIPPVPGLPSLPGRNIYTIPSLHSYDFHNPVWEPPRLA
jgi:hypothetical protein